MPKKLTKIIDKKTKLLFLIMSLISFALMCINNYMINKTSESYDLVWDNFVSPFFIVISVYALIVLLPANFSFKYNIFSVFGRYSFGIYLIHWILEKAIEPFVNALQIAPNLSGVSSVAFSFILCCICFVPLIFAYRSIYIKKIFLK